MGGSLRHAVHGGVHAGTLAATHPGAGREADSRGTPHRNSRGGCFQSSRVRAGGWSTNAQDSGRPRKTRAPPASTLPLLTWQNQRAFQKQDCIFVGKKRVIGKAKKGGRDTRYYKSVGLGIKTPRAAIEGTYVDRKCPWTGAPAALER